jgi:hypothetical protein
MLNQGRAEMNQAPGNQVSPRERNNLPIFGAEAFWIDHSATLPPIGGNPFRILLPRAAR